MSALADTEIAFTAIWSRFCGTWSRGALHERGGLTWFETPIHHLPYNGVVRTRLDGGGDGLIAEVLDAYRAREVQCFWALHLLSTPGDLGPALEEHGLARVDEMTCMSLDLGDRPAPEPTPGVDIAEVVDDAGLDAYTAITLAYWEIPPADADLVARMHKDFGPRPEFGVRFLARLDGEIVGKGFLCTEAGRPGLGAIYGMSVQPRARGRGVAGALTAHMLGHARRAGLERIVLHSSQMAVGIYRRAGFEPCGPLGIYATAALWTGEH